MIVKYNEKLQLERLKETVKNARNSEFYKSRLEGIEINSIEDIEKIPITTKQDLREAGCYGLVTVPKSLLAEYRESFGTTGVPVASWRTDNDVKQATRLFLEHGIKMEADDVVFVRNPYALSAPAHDMHFAARSVGACVIPVDTRSTITSSTRTVNLMYKLSPTIITCIPFEAFMLAETAKLMGLDPKKDFPSIKTFLCAGELLTDKRRKALEETWNVEFKTLYGSTELMSMGSDCDYKNLHLSPENFIFEVLNVNTMKQAKPGEKGFLVVTPIAREAQAILRYNTGDIVEVVEDVSCPCGSKHPILKHYGRYEQMVQLNDKKLLFAELQDIVYSFCGSNFWKAYLTDEELKIKIENEDETAKVDQDLLSELKEKYDFPFDVEFVKIGEILDRSSLLEQSPIGKPSYVVDTRVNSETEKKENPFLKLVR